MTIKKIIAALISAAIAVPLCTSPALADEPRAVGFDNADDTAVEGFGDITDETASESENDPNDLYHNSVDMGSDDEPEDGDALLFDNGIEQLINYMAQTPNPSSTPAPTASPKKTKLVNGSFEYPFITPEMLEAVNGRAKLDKKARWFSSPENWHRGFLGKLTGQKIGANNGLPEYTIENKYNIDEYETIDFGWKTTAYADGNKYKPSDTIELISQKYIYDSTNDDNNIIYRDKDKTKTVEDMNGNILKLETANQDKTIYAQSSFAADDELQCAEIIGRDQSSLYQIIDTFDGEHLTWRLSHIARHNSKNRGMLDSMALFIGPAEDGTNTVYSKKAKTTGGIASDDYSDPNYDLFLWMAEVIYRANSAKGKHLFPINDQRKYYSPTDAEPKKNKNGEITNYTDTYKDTFKNKPDEDGRIRKEAIPVYVHPLAGKCVNAKQAVRSGGTANLDPNATDLSALVPGETYNYTDLVSDKNIEGWKEWSCWFMTDTGFEWGRYEGTYDVPAGQSATTFAFTAVSGNENTTDHTFCEGNLIDDVQFEAMYPLNVTATDYGHGNVGTDNTYVDINNPFQNKNDEPEYNKFADGDEVTITAKADDGYSFNGAYIDNVFYHSSNRGVFSEPVDGTYTMEVTMDMGHTVKLVFSKPKSVMYDPNGGVFDGKSTITTKDMGDDKLSDDNKLLESYTVAASPVPNDGTVRFAGWYFPNAETVIQPGHTVEYINDRTALETRLSQIDAGYLSTVDNLDEPKFIVRFALAGDTNTAPKYYVCLPAEQGLNFIAQWAYKQEIIAMTKGPNDMTYTESSAGGTVSISNRNNSNMTNPGFAYESDVITARAMPNTDSVLYNNKDIKYKFLGFYEDMDGRFPCSAADAYSYSVNGARKIYARFCAELQYPYLSFISELNEKNKPELEGTPFYIGSHVGTNKDGDKSKTQLNEKGSSDYGNTISTGFIASTIFSSDLYDPYCYWDIDIPIDGTTYFKKSNSYPVAQYDANGNIIRNEGVAYYPFDAYIEQNPLLTDDDVDDYFNKGRIYRTKTDSDPEGGSTTQTIKIKHKIPVRISGHSLITYGIILDNVYAPNAKALVDYDTTERTGYMDLTAKDPTNAVKASSPEEYISKSPYFNP